MRDITRQQHPSDGHTHTHTHTHVHICNCVIHVMFRCFEICWCSGLVRVCFKNLVKGINLCMDLNSYILYSTLLNRGCFKCAL